MLRDLKRVEEYKSVGGEEGSAIAKEVEGLKKVVMEVVQAG